MTSTTFLTICLFWLLLAPLTALLLLKIQAPYGKYYSEHWGLTINNRLGWLLMELVALFSFIIFFLLGTATPITWVFFALWVLHYTNRSFIYPLRQKTTGKMIPVTIVCSSIIFNIINGSLNGYYLTSIAPIDKYTLDWFADPRFQIGCALFFLGMIINLHSDNILLKLRKPNETGYKIPQGGLFRYVTCPNYLGEIIEWIGFAIMTWSLPALGFALWTMANLLPRAINYHQWYRKKFPNYPRKRKALLPFVL